jgi:L-lactate dehydrogenase
MLKGEFGQKDVFIGVPCIINQNGIQRILPVKLTEEELEKLAKSCQTLRESYESLS